MANKEVPYVKIMPSRPHEAYQQLQEDDRDYLIGIKESEACPCPELRQLLLMYASRKCTNLDIPICDILQEKFSQDKTADSDHCTIVSNLENFVGELSRLVQLKKCVDYYKELSHLLSDFPNSD